MIVIPEVGKVYKLITNGVTVGWQDQTTYVRMVASSEVRVFCPWQPEGQQLSTAYFHPSSGIQFSDGHIPPMFYDSPERNSGGWGLLHLRLAEEVVGEDIPECLRN